MDIKTKKVLGYSRFFMPNIFVQSVEKERWYMLNQLTEKQGQVKKILQSHLGCKSRVFRAKQPLTLTVTGCRAYIKLIRLLYELEYFVGANYNAEQYAAQLGAIVGYSPIVDKKEYSDTCLDSLLCFHFGSKRNFLKKRKVVGYWHGDYNDPEYEYFTVSGAKSYSRLISLLYDLGALFGESFDSNNYVGIMDDIVSSDSY